MTTPWPNAAVAADKTSSTEDQLTAADEAETCLQLAWGEMAGVCINAGFAGMWFVTALDLDRPSWATMLLGLVMGAGVMLSFRHLGMWEDGQKYRDTLEKERSAPMKILVNVIVVVCAASIVMLLLGKDWFAAQFGLAPNLVDFAIGALFAVLASVPFGRFLGFQKLRVQFLGQVRVGAPASL